MTEIQTRPLRDFHTEPCAIGDCRYLVEKHYLEKDVLAERAAYETQFASDMKMINRMREHFDEKHDAWVKEKKRAEAAEAVSAGRLKVLEEKAAQLREKEQLLEKAEARVKELEAELKRERKWSKYETKQVKARDKTIKALAGEKTK